MSTLTGQREKAKKTPLQ